MTTKVLVDLFNHFVKGVVDRALLLVFDGHPTHLSLPGLALQQNVILLKLPPHVTDVSQTFRCFVLLSLEEQVRESAQHAGQYLDTERTSA